jgi:hypothetical protein
MNASSVRAIARSRAVVALLEEAAKVVVISLLFVFEETSMTNFEKKRKNLRKIFFEAKREEYPLRTHGVLSQVKM